MGLSQQFYERQRALILRIGKKSRPLTNRIIGRHSLIGNPPVFEQNPFAGAAELETHWHAIREEAEAILHFREHLPPLHTISPDHSRLTNDAKWRSFFLYGYGIRLHRNCERCPQTSRLLEQVPNLETAFFSILGPGKHIPPHRGPTKAIVTWHLPLIVPTPREQCFIRVQDRICHWQEGKSLVFDDTYKHEVRNDTDQERVILLMHIRRPVAFPGSLVSGLFLGAIKKSPFVRDARKNQIAWEKEFETVWK